MVCIDNRKGARLELLGSLIYPLRKPGPDAPMFRNDGGVMSLCYSQNGNTPYGLHAENNGARLDKDSVQWQHRSPGFGLFHAE